MSSSLPPSLWDHVLSFQSPSDLCSIALVSKEFYNLSIEDRLWKAHCVRMWKGKQLGLLKQTLLLPPTPSENADDNRPPAQPNSDDIDSWKNRYKFTRYDSLRAVMNQDEMVHFKWKLIYNGTESKMGLREFGADGIYHSPYAGPCQWTLLVRPTNLNDNNQQQQDENTYHHHHTDIYQCFLGFMGMTLRVERNPEDWGWIIGKETSTVYMSVEREEATVAPS